MDKPFVIQNKVVKYPDSGGWYFVEVSKKVSEELKKLSLFDVKKVGWGYIKVKATIGKTTWDTTLFPQKDGKPYLLAIKADVRKKENIKEGEVVHIHCQIL